MSDLSMQDVFHRLSYWLKSRAIDPAGVEITMTFKHRRGLDTAAFVLSKEFDDISTGSPMPSHVYDGTLYGLPFKLKL